MTIKFSTLQMLIDGNFIRDEDLEVLFDDSKINYNDKDYYYIFDNIENINENVYWFYARLGSATPYCPEVINIETHESHDNPRIITQVEPRTQLFCFYDNKTKLLFINNLNLKSKVEEFFQGKLDSLKKKHTISITNVISDPERFADMLSSVNQVKFKYREDLFNTQSLGAFDMFPKPKALLGLDAMQNIDYELVMKLNGASITKNFKSKFKKLVDMRRAGEIKDLVCIGKDKNLLDTVFKLDNITKKLDVKVSIDKDTKLADPQEVRREFLNNLNGAENL